MPGQNISGALQKLGSSRGRLPLIYYASDNAGKLFGNDDASIIINVLRRLHKGCKLDLILHMEGGAVHAAKKVAFAVRDVATDMNVIVPIKAKSAGTILAISANRVEMGFAAELGSVDPSIRGSRDGTSSGPESISSEDIRLLVSMCKDWLQLDAQIAGPVLLQQLTQKIFPTSLASIYRSSRAVSSLCEVLLKFQLPKASLQKRRQIVSNLMSGPREHNEPILRSEAREIGLIADRISAANEPLIAEVLEAARGQCVNFARLEVSDFSPTSIIATPTEAYHYCLDTRTTPFTPKGWRKIE